MNEMEQLPRSLAGRCLVKKLKTVIKERLGAEKKLYAVHRDHFPDVSQKTFYGWALKPSKFPPDIFVRLSKILGMHPEELVRELLGK